MLLLPILLASVVILLAIALLVVDVAGGGIGVLAAVSILGIALGIGLFLTEHVAVIVAALGWSVLQGVLLYVAYMGARSIQDLAVRNELVGARGTIVQVGGELRVRVRDETWSQNGSTQKGQSVIVVSQDGQTLTVEPL